MTKATPDSIRATYDRQITAIRGRRDLTAQARKVAIARAYTTAQEQLAQLQQADTEHYHRQRNYLERKLFGSTTDVTGTHAVSSRDARREAAKLTDPDEAARAFNRAQRDGDADLCRAIAAHAAENASHNAAAPGWSAIVGHYASSSPGKQDTYTELAGMRQPGVGFDFTYVMPSPSELGRLSAYQVTQLAATDLTIHGDGPEAG